MGRKIFVFIWAFILIGSLFLIFLASASEVERLQDHKKIETIASLHSDMEIEPDDLAEPPTLKSGDQVLWTYKKNPYKELIRENSDYTAWIEIPGTQVNYPVLRGNDNVYYLTRNFEGSESDLGSIFMDYRNLGQFNDLHTAIYGHFVTDGSMFGDLHKYKTKSFFDENNQIILNGLYETRTYTIFSAYLVSADDYVIDLHAKDGSYLTYLDALSEKSMHSFPTEFSQEKSLLTLTTCSYEIENGRIIIHAIEN